MCRHGTVLIMSNTTTNYFTFIMKGGTAIDTLQLN